MVLLLLSQTAWAQSTQSNPADLLPPRFIPQSPTVSAFARFDAQQLVNFPTGGSQLSVPLAEVSCGSLRLPVSLAYSYTGLQVYHSKDLVGLGWSLQAGTSITRQVNGLVDEAFRSDISRRYSPTTMRALFNQPAYQERAAASDLDTGPDVFSFSLPDGTSGRFIILDTSVVLLPQQPVYIRQLKQGFQVTTENGIRYQFQATEITTPNHNNFGPVGPHASSWHLTRLISADNADTLHLSYSSRYGHEPMPQQCTVTTGSYYTGTYEEAGNITWPGGPGSACGSTADYAFHNARAFVSTVQAQYLESITSRGMSLFFYRSPQSPELDHMQLVATTGGRRVIKQVQFYHSHFGGVTGSDYRLRLDSLQESGNAGTLPAYTFHYNGDTGFPTRGSAAMDYWGYYNGATSNGDYNTTANPTLLADPLLSQGQRQPADREPHHTYALMGALERVDYPTGGHTEWQYEPGRIGVPPEDIPLSYLTTGVQTGYDSGTAQHIDGGPRLPVTSSELLTFQVQEGGNITVDLYRQPHDSVKTTGGTNTYRDFKLWRRLVTGDTLITNSKNPGAYKILDGQGDTRSYTFHLPAGTYTAQVFCEIYEANTSLTIRVPYRDSTQAKLGLLGPGVRVVKTTTTAAGAPPLIKTYKYSAAGTSSGVSLLPMYGKGFEKYDYIDTYGLYGGGAGVQTKCSFVKTSSDNLGLGNEFNKYTFYYARVAEQYGAGQGAKVYSYYHFPEQFNDVLPISEATFRQDAGSTNGQKLVQRRNYDYAVDSVRSYPLVRMRLAVSHVHESTTAYHEEYTSRIYEVYAGFTARTRTEEYQYNNAGEAQVVVTRSNYKRQRLVRTATSTSTGWDIQHYKRLSDYAPLSTVRALRVNGFNPVVETQRWHKDRNDTDSMLVGGHLSFFDLIGRHAVGTWSLRLPQPAVAPNDERTTNGQWSNFKSDTRYQPDDSVRYDPTSGRLREHCPPFGPPSVYLWGYDREHLIAQIENATYAQVLAILSPATIKQLQGYTPAAQLQALLQPLRTRLPKARVTTYTHEPLVGMSSQTDPSGRTTFYEYDGLGRLVRTRDEHGRILSQQQYHYAQH